MSGQICERIVAGDVMDVVGPGMAVPVAQGGWSPGRIGVPSGYCVVRISVRFGDFAGSGEKRLEVN